MKKRNQQRYTAPKFGAPKKKGPQDHHGPGKAREDHPSGTSDDAGGTTAVTLPGHPILGAGPGLSYDLAAHLNAISLNAIAQGIWRWDLREVKTPLPVEHTPEAVQAWKIARLYSPDGRRLELGAVYRTTVHPVEGEAVCDKDWSNIAGLQWIFNTTADTPPPQPGHAAPDLGCECGFYAWKTADLARDYMVGIHLARDYMVGIHDGFVLMQVELFGKVIQYERGYRASAQRVLGVTIPATCSALLCGRPAVCVDFPGVGREARFNVLCDLHQRVYSLTTVGVSDIAGALGCEVSWASA